MAAAYSIVHQKFKKKNISMNMTLTTHLTYYYYYNYYWHHLLENVVNTKYTYAQYRID